MLSGEGVDLRPLRRIEAEDSVFEVYDQQVRGDAPQRSHGHVGAEHTVVQTGGLRVEVAGRTGGPRPGDYVALRRRAAAQLHRADGAACTRCCCCSTARTSGSTPAAPGAAGLTPVPAADLSAPIVRFTERWRVVNRTRVVVIGAGIVGAACARELALAGCDVTVLDRGGPRAAPPRTARATSCVSDKGPGAGARTRPAVAGVVAGLLADRRRAAATAVGRMGPQGRHRRRHHRSRRRRAAAFAAGQRAAGVRAERSSAADARRRRTRAHPGPHRRRALPGGRPGAAGRRRPRPCCSAPARGARLRTGARYRRASAAAAGSPRCAPRRAKCSRRTCS